MDKSSSSYSISNPRLSEKSKGKLPERLTHPSPESSKGKPQEPRDYSKMIEHVLSDRSQHKSALSNEDIPIKVDSFLHLKEHITDQIMYQQQKANDLGPPYNERYKNNIRIQSDCKSAIERITQVENPEEEQKAVIEKWLRSDNKILSDATKHTLNELHTLEDSYPLARQLKSFQILFDSDEIKDEMTKLSYNLTTYISQCKKSEYCDEDVLNRLNHVNKQFKIINHHDILKEKSEYNKEETALNDILNYKTEYGYYTMPRQAIDTAIKSIGDKVLEKQKSLPFWIEQMSKRKQIRESLGSKDAKECKMYEDAARIACSRYTRDIESDYKKALSNHLNVISSFVSNGFEKTTDVVEAINTLSTHKDENNTISRAINTIKGVKGSEDFLDWQTDPRPRYAKNKA